MTPAPGLDEIWSTLAREGEPSPELRVAVEAALERNARSPVLLDMRGISDVTDFFMIVTGDSDTHVRAISENILDRTREQDHRPVGVEGMTNAHWVLMDFVGIIIHVFLGEVRGFYQLERLWGDAPTYELE